jgi:DNA-binding MarR family transcriptional regulator
VRTPIPLPTLLSGALVAHTIELDNEAEHRLPHRTTRADDPEARRDAPWLVSYALWSTTLQYVDDAGVTVAELRDRARTNRLLLGGLRRWGYVSLTPPAGATLKNLPQDGVIVRTTKAGREAGEIWRPLPALVEARWRTRFGDAAVEHLQRALRAVFAALPFDPPAFLPTVAPTQNGKSEPALTRAESAGADASRASTTDLSQLLSGVLLAFTVDFERASRISLPISANTLRVLDPPGVRIRDLPRLTGVSKEANAMCAGWLERHGCAVAEPDPGATRGKVLRLTDKGLGAQQKCRRLLDATEASWTSTFGADAVDDLREALHHLVGDMTLDGSPLAPGLEPYADNWRAGVRQRPDTLPHHPMVLHRGGYPDGS